MERWIIPCNPKYYNVVEAFNRLNRIDWKQSNKSIMAGDEVYIYVATPIKAIKYRCRVNKANLSTIEIDDTDFVVNGKPYETYGNYMELELLEVYDDCKHSLEVLRQKGLKGNLQSPQKAKNLLD